MIRGQNGSNKEEDMSSYSRGTERDDVAPVGGVHRMLRWYGGGLSEKERVYLQKRSILMKRTCEELSLFRDRLYQDLHGTPLTKANHKKRVRAHNLASKSQQNKNVEKV